MALRVLVLVAVVSVVASESISHVSISFDGQEPVSYRVSPHAHDHAHRPSDKPRKQGKSSRPRPPVTTPKNPLTRPPTTPDTPKYTSPPPATTTTAPFHVTPTPEPSTAHSRPHQKLPSPPRPPTPYQFATSHAATPYYSQTHASPHKHATPFHTAETPPHYNYASTYGLAPAPPYTRHPEGPYHPSKAPYHPQEEPYYHPEPYEESKVPACLELSNATYCLEDENYPEYEIKHAIQYHLEKFNHLYADVADLNTQLSVERSKTLDEETYLCPSVTAYVRPLRALNTDGRWRVIVNNVAVHYETVTQTVRVEKCLSNEECPKVPHCYESKCLQKSIYHRFLVYDPYDQYFPFTVETFKLPASCACLLGASTLDH